MRRLILGLTAFFYIAATISSTALACTGITLRAEDGSVVYGRTLEWGAFDINSEVMIVPRGQKFEAKLENGETGMTWTGKYGGVALNGFDKPYWIDGINEAGLAVGAFYHPGEAEYRDIDPALQDKSMAATDVMTYIGTNFASIDEVREGLKDIHVVSVVEPTLGFAAPLHILVTEPSGKAIAIEFLKGEIVVFEAPLGVMTNSPSYDWHMTNLRNYINLSAVALPAKRVEDLELAPLGAGTGMIGLPGDFTPPSRFIRAVAFSKSARPTENGDETVYELFRILDNFNVPLGAAEGSDLEAEEAGMRSATLWTTAIDTKNRRLYFHTMHNRRVRMVDLNKIDFDNLDSIVELPLDEEKVQDIVEITITN